MKIDKNYFENIVPPDFILTKISGERLGIISCKEKTYDKKYNDLDEINFTTYMYIDNEKNNTYDAIDVMKYVEVPNYGRFAIKDIVVKSEGTKLECKTVTCKSLEILLSQVYLENFVINMGSIESKNLVQFYNIGNKEHSLLHLILGEKAPMWNIGHIDPELMSKQRSFEVSRQDVYSFLTTDVSEAFGCIFLFDTLTNTINIYSKENVGEDTDIHVSYNNLLKDASVSYSTNDIKTCLSLKGSDDLTVREINMGQDKIYDLNYYNSTEYMSEDLYRAYNKWVVLRASKLNEYTSLLSQYEDYYIQINDLIYNKIPSVSGSTDWTEYGLNPLKEQLSSYNQDLSVEMKSGHGDENSPYYSTDYLPVYNTIQAINAQLKVIQSQIDTLTSKQEVIGNQMYEIISLVSMENSFTEDELKELSSFIKEDELTSDNYVVTDTMTDEEKFEMLHDLLAFGEEELRSKSVPQLSFNASMVNLFALKEFDEYSGQFDVGNYIWVTLRDDYSIKAKLLSVHINFFDKTDFNVSFGNVVKKEKTMFTDITDAIKEAKSAATSVSFNQSYWNKASKDTDNIGKMLADGLLSAGNYLSSGEDSEMLIDSRGIFVNTMTGDYAGLDSIYIGGGRILFTDDNWKTVAEAIGRIDIKGESTFGVIAKALIAGYIAGTTIEGSEIIGTKYNNGNGTFLVDENGKLTATSATIKGTIQATDGWFGGESGFKIASGKAYTNNKSTWNSATAGVYLGTDGISLGANSPFRVDSAGNLTANSGTIGGLKIDSGKLYSSNNNFSINSSGQAVFKYVTLTGVQSGSTFGAIGYDGTTTWGNFGGSSYFGSTVTAPFSGTCKTHIESISANHIYANYLKAIEGNINTLNTNITTTNELVAKKIDADTVEANYMEVKNWVSEEGEARYIRADRISTNSITSKLADADIITVHALALMGSRDYINYQGTVCEWKTKTIGGVTITYLGAQDSE